MGQDVVIDLILFDLEIPRDFSILQSLDIWIACTSIIMNFRKDKLFFHVMEFSDKVVKNRHLGDISCWKAPNLSILAVISETLNSQLDFKNIIFLLFLLLLLLL